MSVYAQESVGANTPSAEAEKQVKVAILSDIHYVVDSQCTEAGEKALQTSAAEESRMFEEIDTILSVSLNQVKDRKPDVVLSCGDLLSNGELPATRFSAALVTPLKERPQGLVYETTGLTLQIPKLDVTESIVNAPAADDKYPVEWLGSEVGLLEGSSLPGEGVTVLTGHNHLNTTEIGPFLFLGTLDKGDRLMVSNKQNKVMSYQVYKNYKVASDGFALIADEIHENALILITCEDDSVDGGYLNRRVILAEPL